MFRPHVDLARVMIFLTPLVGASLVAMSRLADYRHDIYDVTFGSLLGMSVAYFSYRRYYRSLRHPKCDVAYPNRSDYDHIRAGKTRDVEAQMAEEFSLDDPSEDESQAYLLTGTTPERTRQQAETTDPP